MLILLKSSLVSIKLVYIIVLIVILSDLLSNFKDLTDISHEHEMVAFIKQYY